MRSMDSAAAQWNAYVCRETVYEAIYALLVGELIIDFAKARQLVDRTPAACMCVRNY